MIEKSAPKEIQIERDEDIELGRHKEIEEQIKTETRDKHTEKLRGKERGRGHKFIFQSLII